MEEAEIHGTEGNLTTSPMTRSGLRPGRVIIQAAQQGLGLESPALDINKFPPRGAGDLIGWCQQTRGGRRRAQPPAAILSAPG